MVKPINTAAIAKETGVSWASWCKKLDAVSAARLKHGEIVATARGMADVSGWWAQAIAVAYEQQIGRRVPGQVGDGTYAASVTRTVEGAPKTTCARWLMLLDGKKQFVGRVLSGPPSTSEMPKRLYWRCKLKDGSRVIVAFETKPPNKTLVALSHEALAAKELIDESKSFWRNQLTAL